MVSVDAPRTGMTVYLVFCIHLTECFYVCLSYLSHSSLDTNHGEDGGTNIYVSCAAHINAGGGVSE